MLKVLHVIPSLSRKHGGPSYALPLMERALRGAGVDVSVATTDDDGPGARLSVPIGVAVTENDSTRFFFRKQTEFYKWSPSLARWLSHRVSTFHVVHVHALFSHASITAARAAYRHNVPYVVRPLGVLNRYGMTQRRVALKHVSLRFVERPLLRRASAMHYTTDQERIEAEETGATAPAAIIPLGLDLEPFLSPCKAGAFIERFPAVRQHDVVLFLSRLDPKKGLDRLLDAFPTVRQRHPNALLVIAGHGDEAFVAGLKKRAVDLSIADATLWTDSLHGEMKRAALALAKVFVLPSYSENFGIAAAEALACGVPSVLTPEVGISADVRNADAGLVVDGEPTRLSDAIVRLLKDPILAATTTANARHLAREQYSLEAMGFALSTLYERILRGHKRPR
jgi:glycosyltransferase involved in cell wall biosynthesis